MALAYPAAQISAVTWRGQAPSDMEYGDEHAAADNLKFVQAFYVRFPQFASNPLYIAGESYGGHFVPQLALKLIRSKVAPHSLLCATRA